MRNAVLTTIVITLICGCSPSKAIKKEVEPMVKRMDALDRKLDAVEKKLTGKEPGAAEEPPPDAAQLIGTWTSEEVSTAGGPAIITATFNDNGTVHIEATSTLFGSHLKTEEGPYHVEGNTLTSDSIEGGATVKFRFEGSDTLVIEAKNGKTYRLHRG